MLCRQWIVIVLIAWASQLNAQNESPEATTLQIISDDTTLRNEVDSSTSKLSADDSNDSVVNFAANADDLEDVLVKEEVTSFKGLQLEEASTTKKSIEPVKGDQRNIYKVTRSKLAEASGPPLVSSKQEYIYSFEVYKQLFDQSQWNAPKIASVLKGQCAKDMQMFLDGLADQVKWALQGKLL